MIIKMSPVIPDARREVTALLGVTEMTQKVRTGRRKTLKKMAPELPSHCDIWERSSFGKQRKLVGGKNTSSATGCLMSSLLSTLINRSPALELRTTRGCQSVPSSLIARLFPCQKERRKSTEYPKTASLQRAGQHDAAGAEVRDQAEAGGPNHSGVRGSGSGFWHNALQMTQMHPTPVG